MEFCAVCGDKSTGFHYKAMACEGCKVKRGGIGNELQVTVHSFVSLMIFFSFNGRVSFEGVSINVHGTSVIATRDAPSTESPEIGAKRVVSTSACRWACA